MSEAGALAALVTVSLTVNTVLYFFFFQLLRKVRVELWEF